MAHAASHDHNTAGHAAAFNELDPHGAGAHGQHDSHVIVGPFQLRAVLIILLFFTALTVGLAQAEVFIASFLEITLPWWVNVAVAMSIAVVKSLLVMAIFMQLRYDNPINSILMAFCFFALFLFLFFTGLDLFSRGMIYDFKAPQVVQGGTGSGVANAGGQPVVTAARDRWMAAWGPEKFERIKSQRKSHGHGHGHDDAHAVSSPNRTRPLVGSTGALNTNPDTKPHTDGHGHDAGH
jgi:caa(3)-type oxidase subunit IV